MAIEKLPTGGGRFDPSTNSVQPTFGNTARQGHEAGNAANRAFNDQKTPPRPIPRDGSGPRNQRQGGL